MKKMAVMLAAGVQRLVDDATEFDVLLIRTTGPIRGLTNRPPPPFLDALLLHATSDGVKCSADFGNIDFCCVI